MNDKKELTSGNLAKEREKQVYKGRNELGIFQGWKKRPAGLEPRESTKKNLLST